MHIPVPSCLTALAEGMPCCYCGAWLQQPRWVVSADLAPPPLSAPTWWEIPAGPGNGISFCVCDACSLLAEIREYLNIAVAVDDPRMLALVTRKLRCLQAVLRRRYGWAQNR